MKEKELYKKLEEYNDLLCCTSEFLTRLSVLMNDDSFTINKVALNMLIGETLGDFCERTSNEQQ